MRPLSLTCSKALLPFCGRPLLEYSLEQLHRHGIKDVVVVVGACEAGFDNLGAWGRSRNMEIVIERRSLEFGSAGVVKQLATSLHSQSEQFLVVYGDSLFRIDLTSLLDLHEQRRVEGCEITLACHTPDDLVLPGKTRTNYGVVRLDVKGRVNRFLEKPAIPDLPSRYASSGVFVLNREVLELFPPSRPLDFSSDVFAKLAGHDSPVFGFLIKEGYWFDIGTIQAFVRCQFAALDGAIDIEGLPLERLRSSVKGPFCVVNGRALVGMNCSVGEGVVLRGRNIIGDGVSIGDKAELFDCVVLEGTTIGRMAKVSGAVIGKSCRIGECAVLDAGTVLGDFSTVLEAR